MLASLFKLQIYVDAQVEDCLGVGDIRVVGPSME